MADDMADDLVAALEVPPALKMILLLAEGFPIMQHGFSLGRSRAPELKRHQMAALLDDDLERSDNSFAMWL